MSSKLIYHITSTAQWHDARSQDYYCPKEFDRDGFTHCSYGHQLLTVAHRFYRGEKCLVILVIESSKINGKLIEENLEGGTELYPHLYGVLPINAVSKAIAFPCNADGSFCLPEELTI